MGVLSAPVPLDVGKGFHSAQPCKVLENVSSPKSLYSARSQVTLIRDSLSLQKTAEAKTVESVTTASAWLSLRAPLSKTTQQDENALLLLWRGVSEKPSVRETWRPRATPALPHTAFLHCIPGTDHADQARPWAEAARQGTRVQLRTRATRASAALVWAEGTFLVGLLVYMRQKIKAWLAGALERGREISLWL